MLSESAKVWVDSKRRDLTQLMWSSAGIVRRRADMKAALQQLATLHRDVQVSMHIIALLDGVVLLHQQCKLL